MSAAKKKPQYLYRVEEDFNAAQRPAYEVVRYRVVSGPDEGGCYFLLAPGKRRAIHGDRLSTGPEEAVELALSRLSRDYEKRQQAIVDARVKP